MWDLEIKLKKYKTFSSLGSKKWEIIWDMIFLNFINFCGNH